MLDEQVRRGLAAQAAQRAATEQDDRERSADKADEEANAEDFRAVAPPVLSFASGRRR